MLLLTVFTSKMAYSQEQTLHKFIAIKNPKALKVDELSNIYIVDAHKGIVKYNADFDSVAYFQKLQNGSIGTVDITDPMRVLVYYPDYFKVVMLDNMLSAITTIDLKKLPIQQPSAIASARDGGFWVYDYMQLKFLKFDRQLKLVATSNDLRVALQEVLRFDVLFEKYNELIALDYHKGLYFFDRFGDFQNKLELPASSGIHTMQKEGAQLIYSTPDAITLYNLETFERKMIDTKSLFNKKSRGIHFTRNFLYFLADDGLYIYNNTP